MSLAPGMTARMIFAATCLLAAAPARAEVALQPGLWQETETGTENGRPTESETSTRCMTEEEAKQPGKAVAFDAVLRKHCKALDYKRSGDDLSLRLQCGTQSLNVNIDAAFTLHTPQHYSGSFKASVELGPITLSANKKIDAKRIGDCKK